jgi:hypothetical protein
MKPFNARSTAPALKQIAVIFLTVPPSQIHGQPDLLEQTGA